MSELPGAASLLAAILLPFIAWLALLGAAVRSLESGSEAELDERTLLSPRRDRFASPAGAFPG
jgi:hypothetical protein